MAPAVWTAPLVLLALAALGAAPSKEQQLAARATQGELPVGPMSYLVTPAGQMFRLIGKAPVTDTSGKKLAMMISYEGDTRDVAAAALAADKLMAAMGPELQLFGETDVVVQAQVGFNPNRFFRYVTAFHVIFELKDGRWTALPLSPELPKTIGNGSLAVVDDSAFPFEGKGLAEAGQLADSWMATLDSGDASGLLKDMSASFASELDSRKADWVRFVSERGPLGISARHHELYRLQTRTGGKGLPNGRGVLVLYDVHYGNGARSIDQVGLVQESGRWRVCSFVSLVFKS